MIVASTHHHEPQFKTMTTHLAKYGSILFVSICCLLSSTNTYSQTSAILSKSLYEAQSMISDSKESQNRINQTIAETERLQREHKSVSKDLKETNINLLHQEKVHTLQLSKLQELEIQLSQISKTENSLVPMILDLIDWLDNHVNKDLPFYINERLDRIEMLKQNAINPDISISQLYHSVLEAYQIENEYGYSIDTYKHTIEINNKEIETQILRIGRTALYYLSFDATHGGYWSTKEQRWKPVETPILKEISQGIKIANKQIPPSLLTLPLEVLGG